MTRKIEPQNWKDKVLLAVLAHPDDESFGMGGTLALYARRGVKVHLICATRGEAGDASPEHLSAYASVAELREAELRCAAGILNLAGVHFLGYRDSGMPGAPDNQHPLALVAAPLNEVAEKIAAFIRQFHPQVVVTFDPIGGYKHPDHIAIHQATVRSFKLASDPAFENGMPAYQAETLYYHVFPRGFLRVAVRIMPLLGIDPTRFGRNKDINLAALVAESNFPVHARINCRSVSQEKAAAAACHSSQLQSSLASGDLLSWIARRMDGTESYMQAYPPPAQRGKKRDLFENR
jgi:LmbE family N-acetylglucosaminyl deacetylase